MFRLTPLPRSLRFFGGGVFVAALVAVAPAPDAHAQKPKPPPKRTPAPPPQSPATAEALMEALDNENTALALRLVLRGANPNAATDNHSQTALCIAASLGDLKLVQALVQKGAVIDPKEIAGSPPLATALFWGHSDIARFLAEKGAHINTGDGGWGERRPLVLASANGDLPLVTLLLDKGAEINHTADDGVSALSAAAENGQLPLLELLTARGATVSKDPDLLLSAVGSGKVPVVQFLMAHGGGTLANPPKDTTFLHAAAQSGSPEMLQFVLDAGAADVESVDKDGETPLMAAARAQQAASVTFLAGHKARLDAVNPKYQTALDIASEEHYERKELVDQQAATVAALKKAGTKPAPPSLWKAAVEGELPPLKSELAKNGDPNEPDSRGNVPLFYAIRDNIDSRAFPLVKALLEKGANPNATAADGRSMVDAARDEGQQNVIALLRQAGAETPELDLTEAVERGDEPTITRLLDKGVIPEADALVRAMDKKDDHALLKRLLDKKGKVNTPTRMRGFGLFGGAPDFPLHAAAQAGDAEAVRLLLEHGADPNLRKNGNGPTALLEVLDAEGSDVDAVVHLLVEHGADVRTHESGMSGDSVLAHLAGVAPTKTLQFLMDKGAAADVNVPPRGDGDAKSPLTMAVRFGRVDNVRFLLEHGANPNVVERLGKTTLLMELAMGGRPEEKGANLAIAKLLIAHGARLDTTDDQGRNALRIAQDSGSTDIAALIRASGGKKATIAPGAEMDAAIFDDDVETASRLLKAGFDPNGRLPGGEVPLYEAAFQGAGDIVELLLQKGADVNKAGLLGTALHGAAAGGDIFLVRLLLQKGARPDADDGFMGTPLTRAAEDGHIEIMRLLLHAGADPNARRSAYPGSPLSNALKKGGEPAVTFLLKAGADPNLGDCLWVPLFFGDVSGLERLVRAGGKINAPNAQGRTVLMDAALLGQKDVVAWLLTHKANVNAKDNRGRTALMEAMERDKTDCVQLLRKAGAK